MRNIFKNIAMIALAICVAIGSFFVPVTKKQYNSASANTNPNLPSISDKVYIYSDFVGSNVFVPLYSSGGGRFVINYKNSFSLDRDNGNLVINIGSSIVKDLDGESVSTYNVYSDINNTKSTYTFPISSLSSQSLTTSDTSFWVSKLIRFDFYIDIYSSPVEGSSSYFNYFNGIVSKIDFYSSPSDNSVVTWNYIRYTDINGSYIQVRFSSALGFSGFQSRTYYLQNNLDDNQIYQQGYTDGLASNQSNIYNNGYNAGYDVGYGNGVTDGRLDANDYSFLGLIGAVVDAPVTVLSSLFNFTFLGINLWSFITSLLTIALILFVVKIFMRR